MVTKIEILDGAELVLKTGGKEAQEAIGRLVTDILARPDFKKWTIGTARDNDRLTIKRYDCGERYLMTYGTAEEIGVTGNSLFARSVKGRIKK